jgi:molybdenum cofactor synthesis domain-containing protein
MNIEIICTGDELTTGCTVNTNETFLCKQLFDIHLKIVRSTTIGDNLSILKETFIERSKHADIIIVNGGMGPTTDDLSSEAAALAKDEPLVLFEEAKNSLIKWFEKRNIEMSNNNLKQAYYPQSADLIPNPNGTACGFKITINNCLFYFTPGVPNEFKPMVENFIIPDIKKNPLYKNSTEEKIKQYFIFGIGESKLGSILEKLALPKSIHLGYRVDFPYLELKIIGENATNTELSETQQLVESYVKDYIICKNEFNFYQIITQSFFNKNVLIYDNSNLNLDFSDLLRAIKLNTFISIKDNDLEQIEIFSNGPIQTKKAYDFKVSIFKYPQTPEDNNYYDDIFVITFYDKENNEIFSRTLKFSLTGEKLKKIIVFTISDLMRRFSLNDNPYVQYSSITDFSPLLKNNKNNKT